MTEAKIYISGIILLLALLQMYAIHEIIDRMYYGLNARLHYVIFGICLTILVCVAFFLTWNIPL
jgi:hypothetical protein